jgi:hypothetical protein
MVNDEGQLYTIEGIAAAALILTTVYLVLNSTMVFTPGETHIYDMQLEQLGNDVLAVMDQPIVWNPGESPYPESRLEKYIEDDNACDFYRDFRTYSTTTTEMGKSDTISLKADITYYDGVDVITTPFVPPPGSLCSEPQEYYREDAVTVTRWVNIKDGSSFGGGSYPQTVLLEVLLWRG